MRQKTTSPGRTDLPSIGSVLDITPTILALMDLPLGADMDGRPLLNLLVSGEKQRRRLATVPTHDTEEWRISRTRPELRAPLEAERLQQLKDLGYILHSTDADTDRENP